MRWIIRLLVAAAAFALVAVGLLFMLPADRIGQIASDQLERQTGRTLTLSGEFRPTIWPVLGARTGAITISNADWAAAPAMVTAEAAAVGVDLAALIRGEVRVQTLRLVRPVVHLERAADGRVSWDLAGAEATTPTSAGSGAADAGAFSIENGEIVDGRIIYTDQTTGAVTEVSGLTGSLSLPAGAPGAEARFSGRINGTQGEVAVSVSDRLAALAGRPAQVDATIDVFGSRIAWTGTAAMGDGIPVLDGMLGLSLQDAAAIAQRMGVALPDPARRLGAVGYDGALRLSADALFLSGDINATLDGTALTGRASLSGGRGWTRAPAFDADLSLAARDVLRVSYNGRIDTSGGALLDGALDVEAGDLRRTLALAGVTLDPPSGTLRSAAVSGPIRLGKDGTLTLPAGRFRLDGNSLSGSVRISPGAVPYIDASLTGGALDLSGFTGDGAGGGGADGGRAEGWSKEPINVAGLDAVNADLALRADSVNLGPTQLGATDITLRLRDGRATATLKRVRAFEGTVSGAVTLRGGKGISFTADLLADGMQLEPLLGQLAGITRLTGVGRTKLDLTGSGASVHALMNSLSGTGNVELGNGTIRGIDLARMMQNLKQAFGGFEGATEFTSLTGSFRMDNGVLQNVDLSLVSPLFRAGGRGSVDVGGQAMNYEISPSRLAEGAEFTVPVLITGPWSNLTFRPDLEALVNLLQNGDFRNSAELDRAREKLAEVRALLDDPEAAVEGNMKRTLQKRILGGLGLPEEPASPTTGDSDGGTTDTAALGPTEEPKSLEDQVKDGIRNKLLKELGVKNDPAPAPAPEARGTGTALALSVPGKRPRLRPSGLDTSAVWLSGDEPLQNSTTEPQPTPQPEPQPDTRSTEEKVKDAVEDAAKKELKKLFGLGN